MEAKENILLDYAAQKGVVLAFPADLSEVLKDSTSQDVIEGTCALYGVPSHWLTLGLTWDEILRRLFRTFTLAQRLYGVSKESLASHLAKAGGGRDLDTTQADLPADFLATLSVAADSLSLDKAAFAEPGLTLKEVLFESGKTFALDPWEALPPLGPGTITDDFERASLGGNWTTGQGGFDTCSISGSSDLTGDTANDCGCYYSGSSWNNDQTSEVTFSTLSTNTSDDTGGAPMVRCSSDGDGYMFYVPNTNPGAVNSFTMYRWDNGSSTTAVGSGFSVAWPVGTLIKLGMVSTTLTLYKDGASQGTRTEATYASGSPGIQFFTTNAKIENWSGTGEVVAGGGMAFMGARKNRSARRRALN